MALDLTGFGSVADLGKDIIDKIWPNKNDPAYIAAQTQLIQAQQAGTFKQMDADLQLNIEQIKANAAEAAQPGFHFRDGAGWVCVGSFALAALKAPIEWVSTFIAGHTIVLPSIDQSTTVPMLFALLGIGTMHVYQQTKK